MYAAVRFAGTWARQKDNREIFEIKGAIFALFGTEKLCFGVGQIARASATLNTQQTTGLFTLSLLASRPVNQRRNLFKKLLPRQNSPDKILSTEYRTPDTV